MSRVGVGDHHNVLRASSGFYRAENLLGMSLDRSSACCSCCKVTEKVGNNAAALLIRA